MTKRGDKYSTTEDFLDQIKWIINIFRHSLLQLAMNNGQMLAYWRELPYRGQPSKKPPKSRKPRQILTPKEKLRVYFGLALAISIITICILSTIYFGSPDKKDSIVLFLGIGAMTILIMIGVDKGIDAWNKYLRADDLDEPKDTDEKQEE